MGSQVAAWEVVGRMFGYLVSVFVLVNTAILKGKSGRGFVRGARLF